MKLSHFRKYVNQEPKEKKDVGTWDYLTNYADDDLAVGLGQFLSNIADMTERATRPENMNPQEWKEHQSGLLKNFLTGTRATSANLQEGVDTPELEDNSIPYHLRNIIRSAPETVGTMTAAYLLGGPLGAGITGLGGAATRTLAPALLNSATARSILFDLQKLYRSDGITGKVARTFTPASARVATMNEIGAGLEANSEYQQNINEYIADAKQNGTYIPGQTELEAEDAVSSSLYGNAAWISAMNLPTYNALFGGRTFTRGVLPLLGRIFGGASAEGIEELGQERINTASLNKPLTWERGRDAMIAGMAMGGGMHTVSEIANYGANKRQAELEDALKEFGKNYSKDIGGVITDANGNIRYSDSSVYGNFRRNYGKNGTAPSYGDSLATWRIANGISSPAEAYKFTRKKYETQHGDEIRRQSQYDATKEQYARYRDWARDKTANQMSDETFNLIVQAANKYGVPVDHALATAFAESEGNPDAISPAGAIGIMQLMPSTAAELGADPRNLEQNIDAGVRYLKQQYDATGDWTLAHAAYNAGLGNVQKAGGVPNFPETQNYVAKIDGYLRDVDNARYSSEDSPNAVYRGENGGAEGKYWVRNPNMNVSTEGMRPESLNALDMLGKYFFDHTGKRLILNAGTNGDHAEGEFSHANGWKFDIIDQLAGDGALFTADYGKGSFLDQFIQYGRSLGLGMNFEGEGTSNVHLDVAVDGTQWDGNGDNAGGFNPNVSTQSHADQLYNQRITEGVQRELKPKEPEKPLFDINTEDTTTPKLIEQFLTDKATTALSQNDEQQLQFINPFFEKGTNNFIDTPENRQAVLDRYGDELINYIQSNSQSEQPTQTQPQTPKTQTSQTQQSVPPKDKKQAIVQEGKRFLEELRQNNDQSKAQVAFQLQDALNKGNFSEVEKILKDNGRTIQQPQPAQPTQPAQSQQQQPVSKNKPPQNTLTQPKLTQEFRNSVSTAVVDFINRVTPDVNNNVALAPNDQSFYDSLLRITNQHGTNIASYDDKTIIDLAKGLKKIGVNIDVPQVDIAGANKQNLQQLQGLLPLQTRIQQTLDKAKQQRKDAAKTKSKQAQEAYNAKKAKIVAPIQAQQQRKQEIEDEEQEYSDAFYPSSDQQSFLEDEDENQDWTIQQRQQEEQQRQQEEEERREEDAFQKEVFGFRQAQNWLLNNGNEQAARNLEDAIQEKNLYKAHVIIERNKVPSEILNGESPKIQSPIQEKTNAIKNYSTQPTKDGDGSIDDGFVAISKAPIGTRIEITMDSSYPNPKEEFVVVQDSKTGGKALSSLKNYNYALSHKTNPITEPIDYQATSHLYKQFASNIKISYPEDTTQKAKDIYDSFVSRVRQEQNKQMEAGNVKTAQAMEDALQRKDFDKFKKLFTADEINQVKDADDILTGRDKPAEVRSLQAEEGARIAQEQARKKEQATQEATKQTLQETTEEGQKEFGRTVAASVAKDREARIAAVKEILRTLREPKYKDAKAKIEATSGLMKGLMQGSEKAIRTARAIIAESDARSQKERSRIEQNRKERLALDRAEDKRIEELKSQSESQETAEIKADIARGYAKQEKSAEEEHNRIEREESEATQKQTSPEQLRENFRQAQYLGSADTNERLENLQKEGREKRDNEREQQEVAEQNSRINSAKDILRLLRDPKYSEAKTKIENTAGLMTALQQGSKEAIRVARSIVTEIDKKNQQEQPEQTQPQKANRPEEIQPVKKESAQPKKTQSKAVYGNTTEVISDSRTPYKVKYKVVEADDLTTSHEIENGNVFKNNKYPTELQPRQRERSNMQAGLISMAGNLDPKDLMESRNANQGAPVVRNDGVVLNGNGRAAAISYAYKNGTTNGYKESLIQNAERLGLNADDISKMNQPVLVRELTEELTPEKISDLTTSQTGGARMGGAEQAKIDAKKLSAGTLARMSQIENIDLTNAEATELLQAVLNDIVVNQSELNNLTTDDGRINQDGINRAKRAIFAKAYGDNSVIARMSESTDDNVRGITNALLFAAPSIANVQERIKNGTLHKYDLSSITSAVKKLSDLRERGVPVSNYLQEQSLFAEHADSEETREILETLDKSKRSPKKIAIFLKNIANKIRNQGDPRQESLFGKNEKTPLINLIKQAREAAENGESVPLFSKRGLDVDTRIDNFVEDKDLTPQQKLLKSFGKMLGVKTVFFRNADARFHGAHSGNTTYINVNSEMPLSKVFWHESLHWLKANNPELYKALVKAAGITTAQRQAYLEKTGRTDIKTPDEIDEEILADQFEDAAKRTGLFQSIAGKNRGLIQRVVQWLKDTMNKFIDHFRNPDGKLTTKQAQAFADEFGRIANQLKDPNGNKIFRYNRRTRNIELADGRKVEDFSFDEKETRENIARAEREGTLKYSVGNNNNSNKSLWHKVKNAMSSFFGFNTPEKRRRKIITENLRRLNGYRILYGYVDGADDVVIDNLQKLIKSRNAYDWEKLLPVVSEGIAKNLRLNATQAQSNYIADWLTTGALNNTTSPEAKAFEKAMRDNPAMGEILLETRKIFEDLANMDAWDSVKSTIAHRQNKTFWEKIKFFGKNFTEEVLDDLQPLQNIVDTAIKQAPPAVAEMIKRGVNVKQLAQIARGRGATADMMINGNADEIAKIRSELAAQYVGCYFDDFKTLKMIIESVDGDWKGLEAFALAKLSKEMYEKNSNLNPKEEPYTPYMTEERANHIIQTGEAKFGEAQKDLVRFSKILAAMEYDAGLITDATFARFMKGWKEYIPTPRVWDENEDYNKIDFMKAKRGHTDDTWSPVQTIMANTHKIIQACERNKVKLELATLIRFGGFESNLSEVPTGNPDNDNIIRFKENGKTKYLETPDPAIKRAIEAMHDKSESNWLMKMLRATSGFMRAAYTMANPDFAAGNILRDLPDAFIHNKQLGRTVPIIDMLKAFFSAAKSVWTNDADFIEWQMNGGAQASFVSEDVDYIQRSINDATTTRKQRYLSWHFASQLLDDFQRLSEFTENITRVASYKMAKNSLAKAGVNGVTGKQLAALAAREASIDFSKAGRATRTLNKGVLFANAAVQGINQWIEAGREFVKGNRTPLFGKVFRALATGFLPAILQALFAGADDDRKKEYEQAPDWEKDVYWILGSIRIPKGMDFGLRLLANIGDELFSSKPFDWKRAFGAPVWNALPSLTATIITPTVEVLQNHSYFRGAPIDPKSEQHLPAYLRGDANTSDFSKWLGGTNVAKFFSDGTGWSPRKLDYLINGYLGFMGRTLAHSGNYLERGIGYDEIPIIRRFVFTPYKNPKIVKEFYEAYDKQEQLYNEYKLTKKRPDGYNPALHKRIKAAYKQMHEISKRETALLSTPDMNHDELKSKLQAWEKRRIAIAERVFQGAR